MIQEDKESLLQYLSAALPYGVKILHTGWDCDSDTDFDTVETLIGIDDRFIYTIWDKTGNREKHCLSVSNWKPYLRSMSSMTEEEIDELKELCTIYEPSDSPIIGFEDYGIRVLTHHLSDDSIAFSINMKVINWLLEKHFDFMGLIPKGLAIEVNESNNPYEN